jgi:hypothetical protein
MLKLSLLVHSTQFKHIGMNNLWELFGAKPPRQLKLPLLCLISDFTQKHLITIVIDFYYNRSPNNTN